MTLKLRMFTCMASHCQMTKKLQTREPILINYVEHACDTSLSKTNKIATKKRIQPGVQCGFYTYIAHV